MAPLEITHPQHAERRKDMRLEQLGVAAARLGLELLCAGLEPARGVLLQRDVGIIDVRDGLLKPLAELRGFLKSLGLCRVHRPMTLAEVIAMIDLPHATIFP